MTQLMAPGHVYQAAAGTGIQWKPGQVRLWDKGQAIAAAHHNCKSAYDYWHSLEFARSFPQVTHWWFRSAWTQRVRLTGPQGMVDGDTAWGVMQFIDEETPGQMWTIANNYLPAIGVPMPPLAIQPVNLPLRLALARLVTGVLSDDINPDTWYTVTSLVAREELAQVFPADIEALGWRLDELETISLRTALCRLQGLKEV